MTTTCRPKRRSQQRPTHGFAGLASLLALFLPGCAGASPAPAPQTADAEKCAPAIALSNAQNGVSVLVMQDGRVLCEAYANGGGADVGHEIWSGTKSFTGLMAAAAAKEGLLTLDEKVADTITEWRSDPVKSRVTIRELLSLVSGVGNQGQPGGRAPGYATSVATPFTAAPGERFQYGPQSFQIFGELIQRKMKAKGIAGDSRDYVRTRILEPLGMTWTDWRRTPEGDAIMAQGSSFTAREWIKLGEFVRAGGRVNGQPIVDETAFRDLFKGTAANPAYGVSWWLPKASNTPDVVTASIDLRHHADELPGDMVIAGGAGNQRLYVVPSCKLSVVRQARFGAAEIARASQGEARADRNWSDYAFIRLVLDAFC